MRATTLYCSCRLVFCGGRAVAQCRRFTNVVIAVFSVIYWRGAVVTCLLPVVTRSAAIRTGRRRVSFLRLFFCQQQHAVAARMVSSFLEQITSPLVALPLQIGTNSSGRDSQEFVRRAEQVALAAQRSTAFSPSFLCSLLFVMLLLLLSLVMFCVFLRSRPSCPPVCSSLTSAWRPRWVGRSMASPLSFFLLRKFQPRLRVKQRTDQPSSHTRPRRWLRRRVFRTKPPGSRNVRRKSFRSSLCLPPLVRRVMRIAFARSPTVIVDFARYLRHRYLPPRTPPHPRHHQLRHHHHQTKDNVFVTAVVSVQYQPIKTKVRRWITVFFCRQAVRMCRPRHDTSRGYLCLDAFFPLEAQSSCSRHASQREIHCCRLRSSASRTCDSRVTRPIGIHAVFIPYRALILRIVGHTRAAATEINAVFRQIYDAYYRLTDPKAQIRSYVYDVVRSESRVKGGEHSLRIHRMRMFFFLFFCS